MSVGTVLPIIIFVWILIVLNAIADYVDVKNSAQTPKGKINESEEAEDL